MVHSGTPACRRQSYGMRLNHCIFRDEITNTLSFFWSGDRKCIPLRSVSERTTYSMSHTLQSFLILLPVTACSLITLWLLIVQLRYRRRELSWLVAWSVTATILYACHAVYFSHPESSHPIIDTIYVACNLAVYPLYLLYLIALTRKHCPRPRIITMLLAPAAIGCIIVGILYSIMNEEQLRLFTESFLRGNSIEPLSGLTLLQAWWHVACRIVFAAQVFGVVFAGQYLIRHYEEEIAMDYADLQGRTLSSLRGILWLLLATAIFSVVVNIIGRQWFANSPWLLFIPSIAFSILLALIGLEGVMYGLVPIAMNRPPLDAVVTQQQAQQDGGEQDEWGDPLADLNGGENIAKVLREKRLFLRSDLRLADLTEAMHTNRTYVWQTLRDEGTTFSELVNAMRIEYAIELIEKQPEMSLSDICVRSGYSNLDSFYRNFRSVAHCTPREYINNLHDKP